MLKFRFSRTSCNHIDFRGGRKCGQKDKKNVWFENVKGCRSERLIPLYRPARFDCQLSNVLLPIGSNRLRVYFSR